jgi:chorismate synthase
MGAVADREFCDMAEDMAALSKSDFPTLSSKAKEKMIEVAESVKAEGDSIGGILETAVIGIPEGVGEPWFDTVEGLLSHAVFSVPAVKGIEFGLGFGFGEARGSEANDAFYTDGEKVLTRTNNNGGVNGGITNGMPIVFRTAIKPTPSIFIEQDTVDLSTMANTKIKIEGRHDATILPRVAPVIDAVTALVVADMLIGRFGTDYFNS